MSIRSSKVSELYMPYMTMESSKWNILFLCKSTLLSIAVTALCNAFCLLWCRKLEIPSYARLIKPVMRDVIIPLFCLSCVGNVGSINANSFVRMSAAVWL